MDILDNILLQLSIQIAPTQKLFLFSSFPGINLWSLSLYNMNGGWYGWFPSSPMHDFPAVKSVSA